MDNMVVFSISADAFCILLCLIGVVIVLLWRKELENNSWIMLSIFLTHALQIISNLLGLIFKGHSSPYVHELLKVTNFMEFASGYMMSLMFTFYVIACIGKERGTENCRRISVVLFIGSILLLIISQFNGMYYVIDADNYYHRMHLYWISLLLGVLSTLLNSVLVIFYHKKLKKEEKIALGVYIVLPLIALLFQYFVYGIYIILLADTLAMVLLFLIMLYVQTKNYYSNSLKLAETQIELAKSQTTVMLSQIQPHFLFNSLTAISELCCLAPDEAQEAVDEFADYLRGNLDSLLQKDCVTLDEEINHTMLYLSLEKHRFQERLHVEYDLQERDFKIPMLTIQPIVENAVKHGITKRKEGGIIRISTGSDESDYIVTVFDDGVGFDPAVTYSDDKNHVGLYNVQKRLLLMRGGTIHVESSPGRGTMVTMRLPKGSADNKTGGGQL